MVWGAVQVCVEKANERWGDTKGGKRENVRKQKNASKKKKKGNCLVCLFQKDIPQPECRTSCLSNHGEHASSRQHARWALSELELGGATASPPFLSRSCCFRASGLRFQPQAGHLPSRRGL